MMTITQADIDSTDLVVLVGRDGLVRWSSHRDREEVVAQLHAIADSIQDGTL